MAAMQEATPPGIKRFRGINNVTAPLRAGLGWLASADNVNVTDTGALEAREGYTRVKTGAFSGAYSTPDFRRMYLVDGGALTTFDGTIIKTGLAAAPMYWAEVNGQVFFNNGIDSGIIHQDNEVGEWRRAESVNKFLGADGEELDALLDMLPLGCSAIQHWKGRMYAAQYMPTEDQTVIWFSQPLGFHLFALDSDYFIVPGRVHMLAQHDDALIVGTDVQILAYTPGGLSALADYGVVPGQHWAEDDKRIIFWTTRGVCSALPFMNLTESAVSVAPGTQAGGTIVQNGGQKRYVVALHQGGSAFNAFN